MNRRPNLRSGTPRQPVAALRLAELDRRTRRRAVLVNIGALVPIWLGLAGAYYVLPASGYTGFHELLRLLAALGAVAAVLAWQVRRVTHSAMPELQAVQALGLVIPLFLMVFSLVYLSLSHASVTAFSEPLDHTDAMYLTVTIFSTVGFGDIAPVSHPARIVAMLQMLLDLVILGFVVRVIFGAAKTGLERRGSRPGDEPDAR